MKEKYLKIKQNLPLLFLLVSMLQSVNSFGQCSDNQLTIQNRALRGTSETFTDRQATVYSGGSTFELWQDRNNNCDSNAKMTVRNNQTFSAKWDNVFNALAREAIRPGSSNSRISYRYTQRRLDGNSFWGAYGWWRTNNNNNTIVEYYVVEDYNKKSNATYGMSYKRNYRANGVDYELWTSTRTAPTVYSVDDLLFTQVKSVRVSANRASRQSNGQYISTGTIDMGTHFTEWAKEGGNLVLGSLFEVSIKVEGFGGGNESTNVDCSLNGTFSTGSSYTPPSNDNWSNLPSGYYRISPLHATTKSLTTEPVNYNNGNLLLWDSGNYSNQRYYVKNHGNQTFTIIDYQGRVLTVHSFSNQWGAPVVSFDDYNQGNQWFKFRDTGSNYLAISPSYNTNLSFTFYYASTDNGAPVQLYGNHDHLSHFRFRFTPWYGKSLDELGVAGQDVAINNTLPSVYPNPTSDEFTLDLGGVESAAVTIYNLQGQTVYQDELSNSTTISAKNLDLVGGIYLVNITANSGNITTTKLIIK